MKETKEKELVDEEVKKKLVPMYSISNSDDIVEKAINQLNRRGGNNQYKGVEIRERVIRNIIQQALWDCKKLYGVIKSELSEDIGFKVKFDKSDVVMGVDYAHEYDATFRQTTEHLSETIHKLDDGTAKIVPTFEGDELQSVSLVPIAEKSEDEQ